MANVRRQPAQLGDAGHISNLRRATKGEAAEFFGVAMTTIDAWLRRGAPALQKGSRGVPWVFDLRALAEWRYGGASEQQGDESDPDTLDPKARLDWYRGEAEKRKLQIADGSLISAADFERQLADVVKMSVSWAETFPDVMERDAGLTPEQVERVQVIVDRQRERLHKALIGADV